MHDPDDRAMDDLVRRASARPVDELRLTRSVLARIRQDASPAPSLWGRLSAFPEFTGIGRLAPVGFALVLLGTPFVVAGYPADATESVVWGFASGDPALIGTGQTPFVGSGPFE